MNPNDTNSSWLPPIQQPYTAPAPWETGAPPDALTTPDLPIMGSGAPFTPPPPALAPSRRRMLPILGGIAAAVALALLVIAGVVFARSGRAFGLPGSSSSTASSPAALAQKVCQTLQQGNASATYALLSSSLTSAISQARYVAGASALTAVKGSVSHCTTGAATTAGNSATAPATITYQKSGAESLTWSFVKSGSIWQLAQVPDPAIDPLSAAALYCTDVAQGQLNNAYQLLSLTGQQNAGGSPATFIANMQSTTSFLGALKGCTFQQITISADGAPATIDLGMDFANNGFNDVPGEFTVAIANQPPSLIDNVTIQALGQPVPFPLPVGSLPGLAG